MKQEQKQLLLLKDLCARLPCGVICNLYDVEDTNKKFQLKELSNLIISAINLECIKPYLRPMSSMTEEEFKEYHNMLIDVDNSGLMNQELLTKIVDWLDEKKFDHRGLIEKGLALEASEGMYKQ